MGVCYRFAFRYPYRVSWSRRMNQTGTLQSRAYSVVGMTCGHCIASVRQEVGQVGGVQDVDVDLNAGRLVVSGAGFDDEAVKTAVEEAGYQLAA